ncbi:hypothetical protein [Myceligenerans pegani]|uniref:Uncharacterized protein n=1 Tax=Myceligenerans pegani TaxID=2776917 RepID=A0ABR9N0E0_9MICO|nr:hypothetical protein [Myceligenerans sp. TRM 65318]MBE1877122.1 hypothetical protein [Myceligenerans sp. TRM 65318]MBE3019393.1 hypothetical protein [Myceligenerans sp. TRM 65318]
MKRLPRLLVASSIVVLVAFATLVGISFGTRSFLPAALGVLGLGMYGAIASIRLAQARSLAHNREVFAALRRLEQRGAELRRLGHGTSDTTDGVAATLTGMEGLVKRIRRVLDETSDAESERYATVREHLNALGRRLDDIIEAEELRGPGAPAAPTGLDGSVEAQVARTAAQFDWLARRQRYTESVLETLLERTGSRDEDAANVGTVGVR